MDLWVRLGHFNLIFKVHWAVTIYLKLFLVRLSETAPFSHVDVLGEEFVLLRVDDWEGVDGDEDLVAIAVDSDRVIVVLVLVHGRGELDINLFSDASGNHAFLIVPYFEVVRLRWQDVEPLRLRRVVNQAKFHSMRLVRLEPSEFDYTG